ncbi:MAG: MFS transporter [Thermoanaerobaculia bacterium]
MPQPRLWTPSYVLAIAATTAIFIGFYFLIPAVPAYASAGGASKGEVGVVVGVFSIAAIASRLLVGPRMDRIGRKLFLLAGLAMFSGLAASYVLASSLPVLIALRMVHGIGWGWITTGFASLVADLAPVTRRGEAIGYWGLAPTMAMAVGPLLGGILLFRHGFTATFLATGGFALLALLFASGIRDPKPRATADAPYGFASGALLPAVTLFLSSLSYGSLTAFLPVELAEQPGRAGAFFTWFAISILLSRPFAGRLADRLGRAAIIVPGLLLSAIGTYLIGYATNPAVLPIAAVVYGVGSAGLSFPVLMALSIDRAGAGSRSMAMATVFVAYDLLIALGAALLGLVYERWGFVAMNGVGAAAVVLSLIIFVAGTRRKDQAASS